MMLTTTLNKIRDKDQCEPGWEQLLKHLNKTKSDDEELTFETILESNGLDDALWYLRCVDGYDKEIRLFAVWCARQVEHLDKTGVSKTTNDVSERYANKQATTEEFDSEMATALDAAWDAARAAAMATAWDAAGDAARAAAWAAARDAAGDSAMATARAAAMAAAWDAAGAAAWAAARDAARDAQKEQFIKQFCTEE